MTRPELILALAVSSLTAAAVCLGQQPPAPAPAKPLTIQAASSFSYSTSKDGQKIIDVRNVRYGVSGEGVPGLPPEQRLLLAVSTRNRQVLDEPGVRGTVLLEAWPLGADPKQRPIYNTTITGTDAEVGNNAVWIVSRGVEDVEWWTILKLATTQRLFDTYVPMVHFSVSRETLKERYAGFDVPPDDTRDPLLREPHIVGVLEYASEDDVLREALITCDDPERARLLRSYYDVSRTLAGSMEGLTLALSMNYPAPPETLTVIIPILNEDLDLDHVKLPAGLHIAAFKRQ